jgi:hypothetical protein
MAALHRTRMCRGSAGQGQEGAAGLVARGYRGSGRSQGHGDGDAGAVQEEDRGGKGTAVAAAAGSA